MVKWYYVHGQERVGPVAVEALKSLFLKEEINLETYVWRKGFQNWERLKDVSELDFKAPPQKVDLPKIKLERRVEKPAPKLEENKKEESSPEVILNFDWKTIRNEEELFFIKVGNDRKAQLDSKLFGPYSLNELRDALNDKRINHHSLIFAAGMPGWIKVGDTPLNPKNLQLKTDNILGKAPLLIVIKNVPIPHIALLENIGSEKCTFLSTGTFEIGKTVMCSIYSGTILKAKNLKLNIEGYRPREQKVLCRVIEINENARKVMQNYAE